MDRTELVSLICQSREELESALAQFDAARSRTPELDNGWSVQDLLGHLAFWQQRMVNLYRMLARGETPPLTPLLDDDAVNHLNAEIFLMVHDRPLENLRREEQRAYRALLALAQTAPEADLFDAGRFPWTGGRPFAELIGNDTFRHYEEHLPALRAWIAAQD